MSLASPLRSSIFPSVAAVVWVALAFASAACGPPAPPEPTSCPADEHEPNDTLENARELPEMQDDPDSSGSLQSLTVHLSNDADWFRVHVKDTGLGGDPVITASVSSNDFTVTTWFVCDGSRSSDLECQFGSDDYERRESAEGCRGKDFEPETDARGSTVMDTGNGAISTTDCSGTSSDDGTLYIRVERSSSTTKACSYDLSVSVK